MDIRLHGVGLRRPAGGAGRFRLVAAAAVAALLPLALAGCKGTTTAKTPLEGEALRQRFLDQHRLKGQVALIEFGLVGCKLSEQGLKQMAWLHREKAISGLSFVRVEASEDAAAVEKYYQGMSLEFPMYRDPDTSVARAFSATAYPTFIVVGKFGRVRYRGRFPEERLGEWVAALRAEKADPGAGVALLGVPKLDVPKLLAQTKLPDLGGRERTLGRLMGSGGLMLMFVDTACPYSRQAVADIPMVASSLSRLRINTVLINIDEPEQDVKKAFTTRQAGAIVLYDVTSRTGNYWNVQRVPTVMFVDPGRKIGYNSGAVWADLGAAIEEARGLAKGTVSFEAKGTEYG